MLSRKHLLIADNGGSGGCQEAGLASRSTPAEDRDPSQPVCSHRELANKSYDLLCIEGLTRALRVFLELEKPATYTLAKPAKLQEVFVEASTSPLRPMFAGAVLRLARPLNQLEYESFIDLQDKLHQNLCRQRKFVAIGTHDLDTIEGPFRCAALRD